jgi:hypothetical protein
MVIIGYTFSFLASNIFNIVVFQRASLIFFNSVCGSYALLGCLFKIFLKNFSNSLLLSQDASIFLIASIT